MHDLDLTEFKDLAHFTNPPFISESREEGFNQYFTTVDIKEENLEIKVFKQGLKEDFFLGDLRLQNLWK